MSDNSSGTDADSVQEVISQEDIDHPEMLPVEVAITSEMTELPSKRPTKLTPKAFEFKLNEAQRQFHKQIKVVKMAKQAVIRKTITSKNIDEIRFASVAMYKSLDALLERFRNLQEFYKEDEQEYLQNTLTDVEDDVTQTAEKAQFVIQHLSSESYRADDALSHKSSTSRKSKSRTCPCK